MPGARWSAMATPPSHLKINVLSNRCIQTDVSNSDLALEPTLWFSLNMSVWFLCWLPLLYFIERKLLIEWELAFSAEYMMRNVLHCLRSYTDFEFRHQWNVYTPKRESAFEWFESGRNREDAEAAGYCVSIWITYLAYCTSMSLILLRSKTLNNMAE